MSAGVKKGRQRTLEQLKEHYELEKELAGKLRNSSRLERRYMYSSLYNELYRRIPHHPQLTRKLSFEETKKTTISQLNFLKRFLNRRAVFLEVGPGDCSLSFEVARFVNRVYAIDVSEEITKKSNQPKNFQLILSDGCYIPIPEGSANVAYSNQLIEHLHPDDVIEHLQNIYKVLTWGGIYVCITPNRLNGPHDISIYFDKVASGFHLKEYTNTELSKLFKVIGFSKVEAYMGVKGIYMKLPLFTVKVLESVLNIIPYCLRKQIASSFPIRSLLDIRLVGMKKNKELSTRFN